MKSSDSIIDAFKKIKSFDPRIKIKNNLIYISPFYFNYSFITNFLAIFLFLNILNKQNDFYINIVCILSICLFSILIITVLRFYNTICINFETKILTITPNILYQLFIKKKNIQFKNIKNCFVVSNANSTGFRIVNRRYYISLRLYNNKQIILLGSNEEEIAIIITKEISANL